MKVIKLHNVIKNTDSYIVQLPSGRILSDARFSTREEAQALLDRVLNDAAEIVAAFNADKAGA
jgi:hypothetical protein